MPDIPALLNGWTGSPEWAELSKTISDGRAPHALAAVVPREIAESFRDSFARKVLCLSGAGDDGCESCRSWTRDGHPDMIIGGRPGEPPGIADCLDLQWQMYLKPVTAPGRLGVISAAESLSLPAANSLLKITEEPPPGGRILFIAERDEFIQTIRSRVWLFSLGAHFQKPALKPETPPETPLEWAAWIEKTKKISLEELALEVGCWVLELCERGEWKMASTLETILSVAQKRRLSVSMAQDALFALLMGGVEVWKISGDLREA
ncbi:MAG: DNA polymerase III subunit delta' [Synergistaceae bacterium]|jgi:DNA polymerase-3 subunit delta'|nr:DNA polymerase III subunit delta' [Synergistaceae bacterium]